MKKESNGTTIVKNFMKSQGSVFIILLVMCIIASIFTDKFLSVSNLSNVLAQSVTCGIAAIGMTFVILTGGIDLSVGGCIVFSATIGTKLLSEGKVGVGTAIIIMLLLGVLVGVFNGFLITVLKMPAFIATLASSNVTAGLALYISMGKTIIALLPEQEVFLRNLMMPETKKISMSTGYIKDGRTYVTKGPLQGREKMISRIDRHKRLAKLRFAAGNTDRELCAGLEIISKS